jgi:alpha-L-fucosidase 2
MLFELVAREYKMYMEYPAADWREALPTGNGDMGAMLYGNIVRERVMLNDKRYFYLRNHKDLPDFSAYLPELRKMMDEGRYEEADKFFMNKIRESGYGSTRSGVFQPGFDMEITRSPLSPFTNYLRTLDFEKGVAQVNWEEGKVGFERTLFVSRTDDVTVLQLTANKEKQISGEFFLTPHDFREVVMKTMAESPDKLELVFDDPVISESGFICISGKRKDDGITFGAVARIIPENGIMSTGERRGQSFLQVKGADKVLVLIKLFYKGDAAMRFAEIKGQLNRISVDYNQLLMKHTAIHRELFLRSRIDLQVGDARSWSNERLLSDAYKGKMPNALTERMYDYGRYLLICSSAPEGLPANLQGVWNGLYNPPWQGSFFFNENIQMNYWQALQGNMPELLLSLINLVEKGVPDFRENARKYYGCRGILTPIRMIDDFGKKTGAISQDVFFTGGAGWLGQFFFDFWLFTGDDVFLKERAVPYMKEVALFYEDFVTSDENGLLKMYPSDSPENIPTGRKTQLSINATMDFAVMKELLSNLIAACDYLKTEKEGIKRWKKLLSRIPAYQANEDGALKEWIHPDFPDNYHHRHQSHIYPLFPGFEINKESDPRLFEACRIAVEKRKVVGIESQTGWSLAHMANIYARLNEGNEAWDCLNLMTRSTVGNNLFTYHNDHRYMGITSSSAGWPPYQIDANLGYSAAILEMLIYSDNNHIQLLPALPEQWKNGSIKGVRCRGGFEVDLNWEDNRLKSAVVKSILGKPCKLIYKDKVIKLNIKKGEQMDAPVE